MLVATIGSGLIFDQRQICVWQCVCVCVCVCVSDLQRMEEIPTFHPRLAFYEYMVSAQPFEI